MCKSGEVVYLDAGVLRTWSGRVIKQPAVCIDGDVLIGWGEYEDVASKFDAYTKKLIEWGNKTSSIKVLPLYKKLSMLDCYYVIEIANSYTATGFIKDLGCVFDTEELYRWLDLEKEAKKVG